MANPGKVYIGNLNPKATEADVRDAFGKFGNITNLWVARRPPGFAFIEYDDARDAKDAVADMDGRRFMDTSIRVEISRTTGPSPRRDRSDIQPRRYDDRDRDYDRDRGRDYDRDRGRDYDRGRDRSRERDRGRDRSRERERDRSPPRDRDRERERSRERDRDRERDDRRDKVEEPRNGAPAPAEPAAAAAPEEDRRPARRDSRSPSRSP